MTPERMSGSGAVLDDPWLAVAPSEFRDRQAKARQVASEAGMAGLVVYSRGSAAVDMYADVLYLTNHYSQHPYVPDHSGIGSARGHSAVVLPTDGPAYLVVDIPWWRTDLVVADEVRVADDLTRCVGQTLRDAGLMGKQVGLIGTSSMSASAYIGLLGVSADTDFARMDDALERLRTYKSQAEQGIIRRAAGVGNRGLEAYMEAVIAGSTEADARKAALDVLVPEGAVLIDAISASGAYAHHFGWARLPSSDARTRLRPGDMLHLDFYGAFGGYFWDLGRTRVVGDDPNPRQRALLEATVGTVEQLCSTFRPGITAGAAYKVGAEWLSEFPGIRRLPNSEAIIRAFPLIGHGLGMGWEIPWLTSDTQDLVLEPGMYLSAELYLGHPEVGGVMFEQNGFVTTDGFQILSSCTPRWWS